jgi:hypothetical protein
MPFSCMLDLEQHPRHTITNSRWFFPCCLIPFILNNRLISIFERNIKCNKRCGVFYEGILHLRYFFCGFHFNNEEGRGLKFHTVKCYICERVVVGQIYHEKEYI